MTLQECFCKHYQCAGADFARVALKKFMHRPWNRLAPVLLRWRPEMFATERLIIDQLGRVTGGKNLSAEIRDLRADYIRQRDYGFLRKVLRFRLSGRHIARACGEFWPGVGN